MPLRLYRRHVQDCAHYGKPRNTPRIKCECPIWVQGTLGRETIRRSLNLTSWQAASDAVKGWEASGEIGLITSPIPSIPEAVELYLRDCESRSLSSASLQKADLVLRRGLLEFCRSKGFARLKTLDTQSLSEFRASWKVSAITASKRLELLKSFFRFCSDRGWVTVNPARPIKPPKITQGPTLPFTDDEFRKITVACLNYPIKGRADASFRDRLYALVVLMRFSGLRIGDAVYVSREKITDGKLLLRTEKTGTRVFVPLPPIVLEALEKINYNFVNSEAKPKHIIGAYQRSFLRMSRWCGVSNVHAHRFRDSFSVALLEKGVPIERVSILLGHSSVRITEKHYRPWVKSLQDKLESDVISTWT